MQWYDYFQIASIVFVLVIIIGRASYLHLTKNIRVIVIGGGKRGLMLAIELVAFAGLALWLIEILLYALHSEFRIFPSPLDRVLIDSTPARIAGTALITAGFVIFILALFSFGDSWRVGFDVKTPGALVTTGIFAMSRNPIYVFLLLWFLGIFLINGTLIFINLCGIDSRRCALANTPGRKVSIETLRASIQRVLCKNRSIPFLVTHGH